MVFTYIVTDGYQLYVGFDKYENEELIKYALPQDLWFHVDTESSAHVYLRMKEGDTMDTLSDKVIEDCCQLVKSRSIKGCKLKEVKVVYTLASNLKKTNGMDIGQVGFHDEKMRRFRNVVKNNTIVNRIEKVRKEKTLEEHKKDYYDYQQELKRQRVHEFEEQKRREEENKKITKQKYITENYLDVMGGAEMTSNQDEPFDEDDFM